MFTLQDTEQLHKLMEENSHNAALIKKLLDSHQFALSRISHEIRNPLTTLSSTLQLIEKQHPEVSDYAHWSNIREDIDFMEKLLEELSLYNSGNRLQKRLIHTSDFLKHTVLSFASASADDPIEFTAEIDQNLCPIRGEDVYKRQEEFYKSIAQLHNLRSQKDRTGTNASPKEMYMMKKYETLLRSCCNHCKNFNRITFICDVKSPERNAN